MRFDPFSFSIGFLSAAGLSLVVWRLRMRLAQLQETAETQIEGTRQFVGRSAAGRYERDLLRYLQERHVAGRLVHLTDVLVEPRLIPAVSEVNAPDEDGEQRGVYDVVPLIHDLPQGYASFNIETIALTDLGAGDRHIAILGQPGMGTSTALTALALLALGAVTFEPSEDQIEQAVLEQEQHLSQDERRQRAEERAQLQARALEQLHNVRAERRQAQAEGAPPAESRPAVNLRDLTPVLAHLNDFDFDPAAYGKSEALDPAEPLVRAVQRHVTAVTAQVIGSVVYPLLERGQALVLIDGFDELSPAAREAVLPWLREFMTRYGHNMIVVAGSVSGYDPLAKLGFTATYLRAWHDDHYTELVRRWSAAWMLGGDGKRKASPPDEQVIRRISVGNRGLSVLDVTLKIWAGLANDARIAGRAGWYDAWINRRLSHPDLRNRLPDLAVRLVEAGQPVLRAELAQALSGAGDGDRKSASETGALLAALEEDGLLATCAGDRISLPHIQFASFLAGEWLAAAGSDRAAELALEPAWDGAFTFAAASLNMLPAIYRRLSVPPDLLYSNLFGLARWLPDAPPDVPWRGDVFKRLAAALMAPDQYPAVRERALAALIASRDKNVVYVLRQALRSAIVDVRRLACVGLGALGDSETVKDLAPLLDDDHPQVRLAAAVALGAIGGDRALETMVHGLLEGSEDLRRAIAEALAAIPGEGHAILRDGIAADDMMIRRAAVYGLSRVGTGWALAALYRAMLEDEQWYVRAAAEEAFAAAQSPERSGPRAMPEADAQVWLIQWAAERGEGVPAGPNARQVLVRALQEGQPAYKALAARTLGYLGHVAALKPLYAALRDRDPDVRSAAYAALADLQLRLGQPLPGLT